MKSSPITSIIASKQTSLQKKAALSNSNIIMLLNDITWIIFCVRCLRYLIVWLAGMPPKYSDVNVSTKHRGVSQFNSGMD